MIIYKIQNKIDGKCYIGQTTRSLEERLSEHRRNKKSIMYRAFNKHGFKNFTISTIYKATTLEELNEVEIQFIQKYNALAPNGYNLCHGGGNTLGYKHTTESKLKMSATKSKMYLGESNPFYGKTHSEEVKGRFSKQRKGRTLPQQWRENMAKSRQKRVVQVETGIVFDSIKSAALHCGVADTNISRACRIPTSKSGGYHWKYEKEVS